MPEDSMIGNGMSVKGAHEALDEVLREERRVLTLAQGMVNQVNVQREKALANLRQAIANEPGKTPISEGKAVN